MIQENIPFTLKIKGTLIFDSENNNIMLLSFEDTYFIYNGNSFPYEGLNFKFKK